MHDVVLRVAWVGFAPWRVCGNVWGALCLAVALCLAFSAGATQPAGLSEDAPKDVSELRQIETLVMEVASRAAPATVSLLIPAMIHADAANTRPAGSGSAVIVTPEGYALTAAHVIERPGRKVQVAFADGTFATARTLGVDLRLDVGLIKLDGQGPWPCVERAEVGAVNHGDWVVALGHPGGFDPARPVVVRLGRVIRLRPVVGIQSDCALIGGDSGGPLFDLEGKVVGIHTRIGRSARTNVSASMDDIWTVWDGLLLGERAWEGLGAVLATHPQGVRVAVLNSEGSAAKAGLEQGDVIEAVDGVAVSDPHAVAKAVAERQHAARLTLTLRRGDETLTREVELEDLR